LEELVEDKMQELLMVERVSEFLVELVLGAATVEVPGGVGERKRGVGWHVALLEGTR
jgi:hypothetical protein